MKNFRIFLIIILISNNCFCDNASTPLKKGQAAPFDGVLVTNEQANKIKDALIDNDGLKKINEYQATTIDLQKKNADVDAQKITLLSQQNDKLSTTLESTRQFNTWEKVLFIGLGIVAAGVGAYAFSKTR